MHSSIINKIRILKPRKKPGTQSNILATKSFTINNDNCHSSLVLKDSVSNDKPPPLESPQTEEINKPINKWVPFYVINVPKVNIDNTKSDVTETTQTIQINNENVNSEPSNSSQEIMKASPQTLIYKNNSSNSPPADSPEENWPSAQMSKDDDVSPRTIRTRNVKGNKGPVQCFLCPTIYDSVKEMQAHYLENHKHKRRGNNSNNSAGKTASKKTSKSSKLKDPLNITDEDTTTGDGEPKCPICSIYFKTKDEVKFHMTKVHSYKCEDCDNTFYTLYQFTDHRCSKVIVKKKPKLKKKKLKSCSEEDPLALQTSRRFVNILPKNAQTVPVSSSSSSFPMVINYPVRDQMVVSQTHISDTQTSPVTSSIPSSVNLNAPYNQMVNINNNNINNNNNNNVNNKNITNNENKNNKGGFYGKSLLNCSLEELTSKDFNKMKLHEIIKNPQLSVNWIPKKSLEPPENQEFFSCGRCNVLCEDNSDYVEHLEECLRLSNVSLIESSTSGRLLKLKSEIIPQKDTQKANTSINKMLLKELRSIIGPENYELFDTHYDQEKEMIPHSDSTTHVSKSDFTHPDIKGNISITRIRPSKEHLKSSESFTRELRSNEFSGSHKLPLQIIPSLHHPINTSSMINGNARQRLSLQQPMVIIPLNNSEKNGQILSDKRDLDNPDYPNISITDKSNSVTWNFIGSETGSILRVESPYQNSLCSDISKSKVNSISLGHNKIVRLPLSSIVSLKNSNKISTALPSSKSPDNEQEPDLTLKEEPLSPPSQMDNSPSSLDDFKATCSMELVLDDEEIKMEVEDEVVDDQF